MRLRTLLLGHHDAHTLERITLTLGTISPQAKRSALEHASLDDMQALWELSEGQPASSEFFEPNGQTARFFDGKSSRWLLPHLELRTFRRAAELRGTERVRAAFWQGGCREFRVTGSPAELEYTAGGDDLANDFAALVGAAESEHVRVISEDFAICRGFVGAVPSGGYILLMRRR